MDLAKLKNRLPQEGTSSAGESLPELSSGCPTVSGGGEILRDSETITTTLANTTRTTDTPVTTTLASSYRTTDMPAVVLERDPMLDRFSVKHWADKPSSFVNLGTDSRKRSLLVGGAGGNGKEASPSKITTARRGKARNLGDSQRPQSVPVATVGLVEPTSNVEPTTSGQTQCGDAHQEVDEEPPLDIETLDPARLRALASTNVSTILEVCKKSSNLKGTCVKALKEAARTLQEITATALTRTVSAETLLLRRETRKLREEVAELKAEIAALRGGAQTAPSQPLPQPQPELPGLEQNTMLQALVEAMEDRMGRMEMSLLVSCGDIISARLEAIEDRLLPAQVVRPALAADKKSASGSASSRPVRPKTALLEPAVSAAKPRAKVSRTADQPLGMEWVSLPSSAPVAEPTTTDAEWSTVTRRRKAKKKPSSAAPTAAPAVAPTQPGRARGSKPKTKLPKTPRSAAVLITLQPGALAGGDSYLAALTRAKSRVNLSELGIENIQLRPTATGARILEIPGDCGSEKADGLARQLREALGDAATVIRPIKKVGVRLVGLEDSVSVEDVIAAAAAKGGCEPALIRAGEIRTYGRGSGVIHLSLPVAAARVLVEAKRLLVGWSTVRVRLLKTKTFRCFRCLEVGHTRSLCSSEIDRGLLCFRCGLAGHKAQECTAEKLHCALCADAGRSAEHYMGGAACRPPTQAKGGALTPAPGRDRAQTDR